MMNHDQLVVDDVPIHDTDWGYQVEGMTLKLPGPSGLARGCFSMRVPPNSKKHHNVWIWKCFRLGHAFFSKSRQTSKSKE